MPIVNRVVELHKKQCKSLIKGSNNSFTIRLPVPKVTTGVNPLYGNLNRENNEAGQTVGPISCLWHDALSVRLGAASGLEPLTYNLAGHYSDATAIVEVWLEEILIDINKPHGETWLDRAKNIIYSETIYQILGYTRLGLPTSSPYLGVIALKGSAGYGIV